MKLVIVSVHFEYTDAIESLVDEHRAEHYLVYPRIEGRDSEGFHEGSQVHPGNLAAIHVRLDDDAPVGESLRTYLRLDDTILDIAEGVMAILGLDSMTGQMLALDGGQHLAWRPPDPESLIE